MILLPNISEASPASNFRCSFFKGKPFSRRIILGWRRVFEEPAQVNEMLLSSLTFRQ